MVYGHANDRNIEETLDDTRRHAEQGYHAIRLQSGVPGPAAPYGVAKAGHRYEPADGSLPSESLWSTSKYLRSVPDLFEAGREALGWDVHLLQDIHHRLTPIEAARLGQDLDPYRPFWPEDPPPLRTRRHSG